MIKIVDTAAAVLRIQFVLSSLHAPPRKKDQLQGREMMMDKKIFGDEILLKR